jgi:hypothetical protein
MPDAEMETAQLPEMFELATDAWLDPRAMQTMLPGGTAYAVVPAAVPPGRAGCDLVVCRSTAGSLLSD